MNKEVNELIKKIVSGLDETLPEEDIQNVTLEIEKFTNDWNNLDITSDFIFCKIMQDEELLAELIRRILPDLEFTKIEVIPQKTVDVGLDIHGVRFDIYVKGNDGTVVLIEMQVLNRGNLPKRMRYYSSMADADMLEKGIPYGKLKDCYIAIICPFDLFGKGLHKYTFTYSCKELEGLELGDGTTMIVLNADSKADDVDIRLKAFLDYVAGRPSDDEYVRRLDLAVRKARQNKEWRREYMTLYMRDLEKKEEGREEKRRLQIEKLLRKGKTAEEIIEFNDYPIELVKSVEESISATHS